MFKIYKWWSRYGAVVVSPTANGWLVTESITNLPVLRKKHGSVQHFASNRDSAVVLAKQIASRKNRFIVECDAKGWVIADQRPSKVKLQAILEISGITLAGVFAALCFLVELLMFAISNSIWRG